MSSPAELIQPKIDAPPVQGGIFDVEYDWASYYELFKEKHGRDPVQCHTYKRRVLFPDGWTYGISDDSSGPEYPPPDDPIALNQLQIEYWTIRWRMVRDEVKAIETFIHNARQAESSRDLVLKIKTKIMGDDGIYRWGESMNSRDYIKSIVTGRLSWLEEDLVMCFEKMKELSR